MNIKVELNTAKIENKVTNDNFGRFAAQQWKRIIDPYVPRNYGILEQNVDILPFALHYKEPYAHYQYEGILYVDSDYNVGAFYSPYYVFWSRPNVTKEPSQRKLKYQKNNPYSTDHWDKAAEEAGQKEKLYRILNTALKSGQI